MKYEIFRIQDRPELKHAAAKWFHEKWNIPREVYLDSMDACLRRQGAVPQWYVVLDGNRIIAGLGVIENDFHDRKDLTPNVCAVYVEEPYRCQGIAGEMLCFVYGDMKSRGVATLYLLTDHCSFYERYGWEFLCMVRGNGDAEASRMYIHSED